MEEILNKVQLTGIIESAELGYSRNSKTFVKLIIRTDRLNTKNSDIINTYIEEEIIKKSIEEFVFLEELVGKTVDVEGEFRSRNQEIDGKRHCELYVYINKIDFVEDKPHENKINLKGYICKNLGVRTTPKGRKICDLIFASHRKNKKSDYIPCIVWGDLAEDASSFKVGDFKEFFGRIQSRIYTKDGIDKTAYEVSITNFV